MKRRKVQRMRGSKTHGHGSMKKRRGAGHRGGRGAAGSGKRADSKKPSTWKDTKYFGRSGFVYHGRKQGNVAINVGFLDEHVERFVADKAAAKVGDAYTIDLEKLGYDKLLSKGKVTRKFKIAVPFASKKAIAVIEKAGGAVETRQ